MREQSADPLPMERGDSVGRYLVVDLVGQGGLGTVYRAYDPDLDRAVALKEVRSLNRNSAGERSAVLREAQAMARLTHPNVVGVYDVLANPGGIFIAMELVDGQDVAHWLMEDRSLDEVLRVFVDCAKGLAAAHRANLLHGDCNPANLLVNQDCVGKVADFGLARPVDQTVATDANSRDRMAVHDAGSPAQDHAGGTTAYLAPECREGSPGDARSDQYSFCLALFEAVVGRRPGPSVRSSPASSGDTAPVDIPRGLPFALRSLLRRGLRTDPARRFTNMDAVVDALREVQTRHRRFAVRLGFIAVAGLVVWAAARPSAPGPCDAFAERWTGVWDPERKASVARALNAGNVPQPDKVIARVSATLDDYAARWTGAYTQACEAAVVREEQSVEMYQARSLCYERRWEQARAVVQVLEGADATMAFALTDPARALEPLEPCGTAVQPLLQIAAPPDAATEARASEIRGQLADAAALEWAGRAKESHRVAEAALAEANALGFAPLQAEAQLRAGLSLMGMGRFEEAAAMLSGAHWLGEANRDDSVAAEAAIAVVAVLGTHLEQLDRATDWSLHAKASVQRLGLEGDEAFDLANALGTLAQARGDREAALAHYERALVLGEHLPQTPATKTGIVLQNLATTLEDLGRWDEAQTRYDQALQHIAQELGPDNPRVALVLHNLAVFNHAQGHYEAALGFARRAVELKESVLPDPHLSVALTLQSLGLIQVALGDLAGAGLALERARAIVDAAVGPDHPEMGIVLVNIGSLFQEQREYGDARASYTRALAIFRASVGDDHGLVVQVRAHVAGLNAEEGLLEPALAEFVEIRDALAAAQGEEAISVLETDVKIGDLYTRLGHWNEAERALLSSSAVAAERLPAEHPLRLDVEAKLAQLDAARPGVELRDTRPAPRPSAL